MFVYPPSEDSFLLLKWARKICKDKKVLEIGCGTGIVSENIFNISKDVVCTDINPEAVRICREKGLKCILSDLFENIDEKFDVILFNPPYLPEEEEDDPWVKAAIYGGKRGNEVVKRFLRKAWKYLNKNGKILLILSSLSNPDEIYKEFEDMYKFDVLEEKSLFFERIYCVLVRRIEDCNS